MCINTEIVKEHWNSLFDQTLEKYALENGLVREISMILHILQLKFESMKVNIEKSKQENDKLVKEIETYKEQQVCESKRMNYDSVCDESFDKCARKHEGDKIEKPKITEFVENSLIFHNDSKDLFDDMFNQQISEIDIASLTEVENTIVVNDSIDESYTGPILSPKLNKNKRLSRPVKSRPSNKYSPLPGHSFSKETNIIIKNRVETDSIICATPDTFTARKKGKKLKQSTLSESYSKQNRRKNLNNKFQLSNFQNETSIGEVGSTDKNRASVKRQLDNEETLYLPCTIIKPLLDDDEEVDFDVILNDISNHNKPTNISKKLKYDQNILDNSYDCIPRQNDTPKYAHKGKVVRKRADRALLNGWNCSDCEKYYGQMELNHNELQQRMNACSRHRSKFNPRTILTPPGFWKPEFTPTQESMTFDP